MLACQFANSVNDCRRITDYVGTVCWQLQLDHLGGATLPTNLQLQLLVRRSFDDSDVLDQQAQHALAIARFRCRSSPQSWEVSGQLQYLTLLLGGDDAQLLALEIGELRLKLENTL